MHEFMSLDGVIDAPTWTFDYGFTPRWKRPSARSRNVAEGILLGRDLRGVRAGVVEADRRGRPRSAVLQRHTKYVVSGTLTDEVEELEVIGIRRRDPQPEGQVDGDLTPAAASRWSERSADGPVDETHLLVYPPRGSGPRLFPEGPRPSSCRSRPVSRTRTRWSAGAIDRRRRPARQEGTKEESRWEGSS